MQLNLVLLIQLAVIIQEKSKKGPIKFDDSGFVF